MFHIFYNTKEVIMPYPTLYDNLYAAAMTAHGMIKPEIYHKYLKPLDPAKKRKAGKQYQQDFVIFEKLIHIADEKLNDHEKQFIVAARNHPNQRGLILLFDFLHFEHRFTLETFIRICCDYHLIEAACPTADEFMEDDFFFRLMNFIRQHKAPSQQQSAILDCLVRIKAALTERLGERYMSIWRYKYAELILGIDYTDENVLKNIDCIIELFKLFLKESIQADCIFDCFKKLISFITLPGVHCHQIAALLVDNNKPILKKIESLKQHFEKENPQTKILNLIKNIFKSLNIDLLDLSIQHQVFTMLFMHIHEIPKSPNLEAQLTFKIAALIEKFTTEKSAVQHLRILFVVFNQNYDYLLKAIDQLLLLKIKMEIDWVKEQCAVFPYLCRLIYFNFIAEQYRSDPDQKSESTLFSGDYVLTLIQVILKPEIHRSLLKINHYLVAMIVLLSHELRNTEIKQVLLTWYLDKQLSYLQVCKDLTASDALFDSRRIEAITSIQRYAVMEPKNNFDKVMQLRKPTLTTWQPEARKSKPTFTAWQVEARKSYAEDMFKSLLKAVPPITKENMANIATIQQKKFDRKLQRLENLFKTPFTEESFFELRSFLSDLIPRARPLTETPIPDAKALESVDIGYKMFIFLVYEHINTYYIYMVHMTFTFSDMDKQLKSDDGDPTTYKELAVILLSLISKLSRLIPNEFQFGLKLLKQHQTDTYFGIKKIQYLFAELGHTEQLCTREYQHIPPFYHLSASSSILYVMDGDGKPLKKLITEDQFSIIVTGAFTTFADDLSIVSNVLPHNFPKSLSIMNLDVTYPVLEKTTSSKCASNFQFEVQTIWQHRNLYYYGGYIGYGALKIGSVVSYRSVSDPYVPHVDGRLSFLTDLNDFTDLNNCRAGDNRTDWEFSLFTQQLWLINRWYKNEEMLNISKPGDQKPEKTTLTLKSAMVKALTTIQSAQPSKTNDSFIKSTFEKMLRLFAGENNNLLKFYQSCPIADITVFNAFYYVFLGQFLVEVVPITALVDLIAQYTMYIPSYEEYDRLMAIAPSQLQKAFSGETTIPEVPPTSVPQRLSFHQHEPLILASGKETMQPKTNQIKLQL